MTNEQPITQDEPQPRQGEAAGTAELLDRMSPERRVDSNPSNPSDGVARGEVDDERATPLLEADVLSQCRERWEVIQSHFVDSPQDAVRQADELVAETLQELTKRFAGERTALEEQWGREGDDGETESLRLALQQYRSFFHRLLAA